MAAARLGVQGFELVHETSHHVARVVLKYHTLCTTNTSKHYSSPYLNDTLSYVQHDISCCTISPFTANFNLPLPVVYPIPGALGAIHEKVEHVQEHLVVPHQSLSNLSNVLTTAGCKTEATHRCRNNRFGGMKGFNLHKRQ